MTLDPQVQAWIDEQAALDLPPLEETAPDVARARMVALAAGLGPPAPVAAVHDRAIPGPAGEIPVRVFRPLSGAGAEDPVRGEASGGVPAPAVVWLHGGGWVLGDLDTHDTVCRDLAAASGCVVVAVDYRRAPEHRFPAAVEDALEATRWVEREAGSLGVDPSRLAVGGDSAGGNLATVVARLARDGGGPRIRHQALVYPITDHDLGTPSYREFAEGYSLTRGAMAWFWDQYLPDRERRSDPRASPLRADDLRGLPPASIATASHDPLRDEGEAYADRLRAADVEVELTRYEGMVHGFFRMTRRLDGARRCLDDVARALREALGS